VRLLAHPGAPGSRVSEIASSAIKLALICDFLEEHWPSMDLFGDMLFEEFSTEHASAIKVEQLRPRLHRRFSSLPGIGHIGVLWNADRLLNRFHDYPEWLSKQASRFELFHLVDHSYSQLIRNLPAGRTVVTCHDLDTFKCVLDPLAEPRPGWFRAMAQRSLDGFRRAAHVICVSAFTRENLLRHGLFPSDSITVIPPGVDPAFFAAPGGQNEPGAVPGGVKYLMHVGSTIRRKRIDVLLRAFARVASIWPDLRLIRVGGSFTADQARLADELGITGKIIQSPVLSKAQLAAAYRQAMLLVQTSDAEGFGLPVIEAMACGCPVVASDIPPLREAGGGAAEYCPAGDDEAWSETLTRLLSERSSSPESWEVRRTGARDHARRYTWSENAKQTIAVYRQVLNTSCSVPQP
jgi:glycosyltransferase involved in cell wall biosynthesis